MTRNFTFSGHFWERSDNNGVVTLVSRMRMGKQTCEKLKAAFEIRAVSEQQHAENLLRMASNLQSCEETGRLGQVLETTQDQWTSLAKAHQQNAQDLNTKVIVPLSNLLSKQKQLRRELQNSMTKLYNNRQLQTHCVLRSRDRYNDECTKANDLLQHSSGKEKQTSYKRASAMIKKYQQAYDHAMADLEMVTEEWNKQWQHTCQQFELLEEERLKFLQTNIFNGNDLFLNLARVSVEAYQKIENGMGLMDADADLDDFVEKQGIPEEMPGAMDYIKLFVLQEQSKPHDSDKGDGDEDDSGQHMQDFSNSTSTDPAPHTFESTATDHSDLKKSDDKETSLNTPTDSDLIDNVSSLMVGRIEIYNSDDDTDTDDHSEYDYNDFDGTTRDDAGTDNGVDDLYDSPSQRSFQGEYLDYHTDYPENHRQYEDSLESSLQHSDEVHSYRTHLGLDDDVNNKHDSHFPDDGSRDDMINVHELDTTQDFDRSLTPNHESITPLSHFDELGKTNDVMVNKAPTTTYISKAPQERQTFSDAPYHGNASAMDERQHYYQHNSSIDSLRTKHDGNDLHQQPPPPPPLHEFNPDVAMDPYEDNDSILATPISPSSYRVNEELETMLRQLEQQNTRSDDDGIQLATKQPVPSSPVVKSKPFAGGRVRLSGVRQRTPKQGQKLLKELAGIRNTPDQKASSTIFAGSDEEWTTSAGASSMDFFDPFSSLASVAQPNDSLGRQKWRLNEVTDALQQQHQQQLCKPTRRPLPERPGKN